MDSYQTELFNTLDNFKNYISNIFDQVDKINDKIENRNQELKILKKERNEKIKKIQEKRDKKISELNSWYKNKKEEMIKTQIEALEKIKKKFWNLYQKFDYDKFNEAIIRINEEENYELFLYKNRLTWGERKWRNEEEIYSYYYKKAETLHYEKENFERKRDKELSNIKGELKIKFEKYFNLIEDQKKKSIKEVKKNAKNKIDNIKKEYDSKEKELKLNCIMTFNGKKKLLGLNKYLKLKIENEKQFDEFNDCCSEYSL